MCTVGQIIAAPGASNVIAGVVNFTIDIRARRDSVREGALQPFGSPLAMRAFTKRATGVVNYVTSNIEATCKTRNLGCAIQRKVRK